MAKAIAKKAEAEVPSSALTVVSRESSAVAIPDYLKSYTGPMGTENIDSDDITIPRIKVGQDMSDEVQEGTLERGDLFLNLSAEKLAGPGEKLPFVLLAQHKEFVLWRPRKDNGGGILARARKVQTPDGPRYAWDQSDTTFDVKVEGKIAVKWKTGKYIEEDGLGAWGSEIPADTTSGIAATAHHNYIIYLPTKDMVAALSLSRSSAKKAKDFNALLKIGRVPVWARQFTIETFEDQADDNKFYNLAIKPDGFVSQGLATEMEAMFKTFQAKTVTVSQEATGETQDERE